MRGRRVGKIAKFNYIDAVPGTLNRWVRYWDKAGTQDGGCYTVGVKMGRLSNGKLIVSHVQRGQWASEEREKIIKNTAKMDGKTTKIFLEQEPGSGGKDSVLSTIKTLMGYSAYADRPTGSKVYRADPYSVQVNNENVLLAKGDWNQEFIDEHQYYPYSTYMDQVDAASGAFNKIIHSSNAGTW